MMSRNKQNFDTEKQDSDGREEAKEINDMKSDSASAENRPAEGSPTSAESNPSPDGTEKLQLELDQLNDRYIRLYAEFDNYKRRTTKERIELMQSAGKEVIANLLTILDDFDRALKMMEGASDVEAVREGVELISQKFRKVLQQEGLKEMEAIGQVFDADVHEAITNIPAPSADMKGKVVDEVEKGYFLNDKVLRYAKVVVGN